MQKRITRLLMLFIVLISFTGCSVIEGIFKAGMGVGIFIVVAIIAVVVLIISKVFGKK
jgi:lipopolysaccharide export LptBFGC system permease protein LptF